MRNETLGFFFLLARGQRKPRFDCEKIRVVAIGFIVSHGMHVLEGGLWRFWQPICWLDVFHIYTNFRTYKKLFYVRNNETSLNAAPL